MVKYPPTETVISYTGMALGVAAFTTTQAIARESLDSHIQACTHLSREDYLGSGKHPYEEWLGGPLVCMTTNFLYALTRQPQGLFILGINAGLALPVTVLLCVEAHRKLAKGIIRFPTLLLLVGQFVGLSVVVGALWIPGYIAGGHYDGQVGVGRCNMSMVIALLFAVCSAIVVLSDVSSFAWGISAGLLRGPVLGLLPAFVWFVPFSKDSSYDAKSKGAHALATVYDVIGMISFSGWVMNLYLIGQRYGFDVARTWSNLALWTNADEAVAFVTADTLLLHLAVALAIFYRGWEEAVTTFVFIPIMGPGAAIAQALARQERKLARFFDHKRKAD